MKLLRLLRQYDSIKAAVLLVILTVFLIGYCVYAAAEYAVFLRTPTEYLCAAPDIGKALPMLAGREGVRAYSRQKTGYLESGQLGIRVTFLNSAYLADCYSLHDEARTVYMNQAAFSELFGDAQNPVSFQGILDGEAFSASVICTDSLPQNEPSAVMAVSAAELHDADTLRICLTAQDTFSPESMGLKVLNRETLCAAEFEQKFFLLKIRSGVLSAILALLGAMAFYQIYRNAAESQAGISFAGAAKRAGHARPDVPL